jgi:NADH-quinone oxidoreductase subunit J
LVGGVVVGELALVIWSRLDQPLPPLDASGGGPGNTQLLGEVLYTDYIYPVEIAAVILLVAIIAAIALTLRRRKDSRYNDPSAAVRTRREDRIRLVPMPAERRAGAADAGAQTGADPAAPTPPRQG